MKKYLAVLLLSIGCALSAAAQEDVKEIKVVEEFPGGFSLTCGPCGCDGASASRWDTVYGKAVTIVDSDTIVIEAIRVSDDENTNENNKKLFTIDLIGIDTGGNEAAVIIYLQKNVLNKTVDVSVKWRTGSNLRNSGVVYHTEEKNFREVNRYLLEKGLVKYKPISGDALDDEGVTDCWYRLLENRAIEAKLGIWAKS